MEVGTFWETVYISCPKFTPQNIRHFQSTCRALISA